MVDVADGSYGTVLINGLRDITVEGSNPASVIIDGSLNPPASYLFEVFFSRNIDVRNITAQNATGDCFGALEGSQDINFDNARAFSCNNGFDYEPGYLGPPLRVAEGGGGGDPSSGTVSNCQAAGVGTGIVGFDSMVSVIGCNLSSFSFVGIDLTILDDGVPDAIAITGNTLVGPTTFNCMIVAANDDADTITVSGNNVSNCNTFPDQFQSDGSAPVATVNFTGNTYTDSCGLDLSFAVGGLVDNNQIDGDVALCGTTDGIFFGASADYTVTNNTITDFPGGNGLFCDIYGFPPTNVVCPAGSNTFTNVGSPVFLCDLAFACLP